ncbi:MFS transporter [Streptomyces camponoticapitis]|uniref:MFS transporter n=1 Tax=Streptomyces camponoticapitis TaxID=1616125 RepID=A0ABQ2E4K7_9ACTN|nr:MFS transporter [Streptomyces camponoticapitis]GGJ89243.1 MFS transporter [Streptomyces camponoticapitis]
MPSVPSDPSRPPSLWRDRDFRSLWVGQTASQFGAQAGQVTLPFLAVVALNVDATQLGALRAVQQIPILLLSLFVGVWVDRRRSRDVMVRADFGRAVALAAIPVAFLFGVLAMPVLLGVAFLVGVLTVFFDVAYQAALVRLVRRDQLAQGNSALEGSRSAAQVGGPALGGALVSLLSAPVAVVVGAFFFTVSFLSIRRIRDREAIPQYGGRAAPRMRRQMLEGLRFVARDPALRAVGLASAIFQFFFAALMTVYLLFLPRTLHLSGAEVGLVLAAMGPGAIVGSLLSAGLPKRFGYGVVLVSSAALADGVMLLLPALHGSAARTIACLMAINFLFGVFSQLVDVTVMAVRQSITPPAIQGRTVATINFVGMGLTPLGSLMGGLLAAMWDPRTSLLLAAVGLVLSPVFMAVSPLARLGKELPAPGDSGGPCGV